MVILLASNAFASIYDQERLILINDTLNDINIFETFNQKLNFLEKIISRVSMIATKNGEVFDEKKYLAVCRSIRGIQKYRNKIAHMSLAFSPEGKAIILKRKKDKELLLTKTGSFNREELNLKDIKKKIWAVHQEAEETLIKGGSVHMLSILLGEELKNFDLAKIKK
jgi:hypothetical protein